MTEKLLTKLNVLTGAHLTLADHNGWLEGTKGYTKFDNAVKKALGKGLYHAGAVTARLPELLDAFLSHRLPVPKTITVKAGGYFVFRNQDQMPNAGHQIKRPTFTPGTLVSVPLPWGRENAYIVSGPFPGLAPTDPERQFIKGPFYKLARTPKGRATLCIQASAIKRAK